MAEVTRAQWAFTANFIHRQKAELGVESVSPVLLTLLTADQGGSVPPSPVTVGWACSHIRAKNPEHLTAHKGSMCSSVSLAHLDLDPLPCLTSLPTWVTPPFPSSLTQATPPSRSLRCSPSYTSFQETLISLQSVTVAHSSVYLQLPAQDLA